MKVRNNTGPSTVPCGMPDFGDCHDDLNPLTQTHCLRFVRKLLSQESEERENPSADNLPIRPGMPTRSYALLRSRKAACTIAEWTLVHSQRNPKHAIFCCIALCRGQNGFFKGYMHQNYPLFRAELGHGCFLRWRVCHVVVFVEEKWVALVLGVKLEVAVLKLSLNVMCCKCKLATKRMNSVEHSLPGRYTLNPIIFGERWEFSEYTFCIFALAVSQQSSPLHRRDFIFRFLLKGENTLWKLQPGPSWWELKDLMKIDQVVER